MPATVGLLKITKEGIVEITFKLIKPISGFINFIIKFNMKIAYFTDDEIRYFFWLKTEYKFKVLDERHHK